MMDGFLGCPRTLPDGAVPCQQIHSLLDKGIGTTFFPKVFDNLWRKRSTQASWASTFGNADLRNVCSASTRTMISDMCVACSPSLCATIAEESALSTSAAFSGHKKPSAPSDGGVMRRMYSTATTLSSAITFRSVASIIVEA